MNKHSSQPNAIGVRAGLMFRPGADSNLRRRAMDELSSDTKFRELLSELVEGATPLVLEGREVLQFEISELPIHDRGADIDRQFRGLVPHLYGSERGFLVTAQVTRRGDIFEHVQADEFDVLDRVRHWTEDIGLAMWLAKPGVARRIGSDVHVGNTYGTGRYGDGLDMLDRADPKPDAWPRLRELPLSAVWPWLRASQSVDSNFATDPVGRAVHAVGHMLYASSFVTELVWVMVGLESLFTSGEGGLLHQVRERGQALLGPSIAGGKDISEMYRIRSKFLHGKLNFPGPHYADRGDNDFRHWTSEMLQALATGRAMLLASLQELIVRGWHEIKFSVSASGG